MSQLVTILIGFLLVHALYIAALTEHATRSDRSFSDAGGMLPGWAVIFAGGGILVSGSGLHEYLSLAGSFGLQYIHTAIGLVVAAMAALLVHRRLWIAGRIAHFGSPGEALGSYYQSIALRIAMMVLAALFALPFCANLLAQMGHGLSAGTGGAIGSTAAIWCVTFFLFLACVIGGWRGTILVVAIQAALLAALFAFVPAFSELVVAGNSFVHGGIPVPEGVLADAIPGVIQYSAGIGKSLAQGGMFTTAGIASTALSLVGLVLSPAYLYMTMTAAPGRSSAFSSVWVICGIAGLLLLVAGPFLAARIGSAPEGIEAFAAVVADSEVLAAAGLVLLPAVSAMLTSAFFIAGGALLVNRELVLAYMLPQLDASGAKLSARIVIAIAFALAASMASFAPLTSAILQTLALPLSVQLLPALLGLAFVPWISRSAILTGLIFGGLFVFFTEPPGLMLVEGLLIDLPWGRWPLTIHSAAWGLAFNFAAVLLVSIFTRKGAEREHRDRLHREFAARWRTDFGGPAARGAKWSLTLIWAFLAIGPGAILGNTFFDQPFFTEGETALGIPSLWAWQLLFWPIGLMLVWWIAYRSGLGITNAEGIRHLDLKPAGDRLGARKAPGWIARGIGRLTER